MGHGHRGHPVEQGVIVPRMCPNQTLQDVTERRASPLSGRLRHERNRNYPLNLGIFVECELYPISRPVPPASRSETPGPRLRNG